MRLRFLGKDPNSEENDCPALYATHHGTYVQGKVVTDTAALADLRDVAVDETAVEVPREVLRLATEA